MAFYIFDLDGTLANVEHRRHFIDRNDWDGFFEACDQDLPFTHTINLMRDLLQAGHRVEIWSGRSAQVEQKTRAWLLDHGVDPRALTRMRPVGDYQPDEKLKRAWLHEELAQGNRPDIIYDDRQKVVDMWRKEGMECYQVNAGDFDSPTRVNPNFLYTKGGVPLFTILIGPAGAGKTTLARAKFDPQTVISADQVRKFLTGSHACQDRNKDVWTAIGVVVRARLSVGLPTVLDATNIRRADRVRMVGWAAQDQRVAYLVIERPVDDIERTAGERLDVFRHMRDGSRVNLVRRMDQVFQSNLKDILKGDGLPNVDVFRGWNEYAAALESRAAAFFAPTPEPVLVG